MIFGANILPSLLSRYVCTNATIEPGLMQIAAGGSITCSLTSPDISVLKTAFQLRLAFSEAVLQYNPSVYVRICIVSINDTYYNATFTPTVAANSSDFICEDILTVYDGHFKTFDITFYATAAVNILNWELKPEIKDAIDVSSEISHVTQAFTSADSELDEKIDGETARAEAFEQQLNVRITTNEASIVSEVLRVNTLETNLGSRITQTETSITSEINRASATESLLSSRIAQTESGISLVVSEVAGTTAINVASIVAAINASGSTITLDADKINLSSYVTIGDLENDTDIVTIIRGHITAPYINALDIEAKKITVGSIFSADATANEVSIDASCLRMINGGSGGYITYFVQSIDTPEIFASGLRNTSDLDIWAGADLHIQGLNIYMVGDVSAIRFSSQYLAVGIFSDVAYTLGEHERRLYELEQAGSCSTCMTCNVCQECDTCQSGDSPTYDYYVGQTTKIYYPKSENMYSLYVSGMTVLSDDPDTDDSGDVVEFTSEGICSYEVIDIDFNVYDSGSYYIGPAEI